MAKLWTYMTIMVGLVFVLKLSGIPTGLDWFLTWIGFSDAGVGVTLSQFVITIVAMLTLAAGTGIAIGFFGGSAPEYAMLAPFAAVNLVLFASVFVGIVNYMSSAPEWLYYPILVIFSVLTLGYIWAVVEWVFGRGD